MLKQCDIGIYLCNNTHRHNDFAFSMAIFNNIMCLHVIKVAIIFISFKFCKFRFP